MLCAQHKCPTCDKSFSQSSSLNKHIRVCSPHTDNELIRTYMDCTLYYMAPLGASAAAAAGSIADIR